MLASALVAAATPLVTHAAGLGKVTVLSALGQPLRAEVEVFATREELSGLRAQLASPEAFKQAGVDYASTLLGIRFTLDKRPNGQAVIRLSSDRPINDPFVDLLLEINWPTGRVIREYTFLLDPAEYASKTAAAPVLTRPVVPPRQVADERALDRPRRVESYSKPRVSEQAAKGGTDTYEVRRGETLGKIASELRPEGVSLDQMLVGLFQANQDAFDRGNMNRLKAGRILAIPDKATLEAIPRDEAKRVVIAQSSDWGGYRRKLAAGAADAPLADEPLRQQATGRITTRVEDRAAPTAEPKDQLKVSKTEPAGGKPVVAAKRTDEDLIAKEKALKEANERLASLEKNVAELQRLVELKSQTLAELEKQAASKAAPPVEAKKVVEEARAPVATPAGAPAPSSAAPAGGQASPPAAPAVATKPADQPAEGKPGETLTKVEAKPEEPPKAEPKPEEPKPAAEAPKPVAAPKPKIAVAPPPPVEEPSFVAELMTSTPFLAGGGGIMALLAAYWLARRRHQSESERSLATTSTLAPRTDSLVANSVFRNTGGQSVDTSHSMAQTDFSQAGPGSIDTDEVDPVAEADVYMAYGRDAQAEEILLEAKQKDPLRHAIHLKLLEIYLGRKDVKPFDTLATELFSATGGVGADWAKAAAMGLQLDPKNPMYGAVGQSAPPSRDAETTIIVRPASVAEPPKTSEPPLSAAFPDESPASLRDTLTKPGELSLIAAAATASAVAVEPAASDELPTQAVEFLGLDFDLGIGDAKPATAAPVDDTYLETTLSLPKPAQREPLDFDLATSQPKAASPSAEELDAMQPKPRDDIEPPEITMLIAPGSEAGTSTDDGGLDFAFDLAAESSGGPSATTEVRAQFIPEEVLDIGSAGADALEFDVRLTESTVLGEAMQHPSFDMSSISLDLAEVDVTAPAAARVARESLDSAFEVEQEDTLVNPDFSVDKTDAGLDSRFPPDIDLTAEPEITSSEEVATKIDLARAYQEMGDLEGARELLQEVLRDGDALQRDAASAILASLRD
ncbi:FimV/HubP family polar landmark protein [Accumulibacter sp.]|uniref:FimV/HubP family polar landmark protein n=1 Tax=Accumulibacter sp. TaxID=2053492 RepID=UPI002613CC61|nr:FimV/HubP family polar landmark protein [Accumulibacter sp.]